MNSNNVLQKVRMMVFGFLMLFILNPISVSANGVSDAIQKVVNVYPNSCSYFTSDGKSDSNSSDSRCSLVNIPSRGGLPSGKTVKDAKGGNAWSCHGFAEYVWYVVFGHCTNTQAKKISASELKVGDFIRFTGHSAIYLGENGNYYYVYDSNWASPADNKVRYNHTISKSRGIEYCYRATNYDSVANESPAHSGNNPFGQIDGIESTYEGVKISGWAVDMDAPNDPVEVHIYVGGAADSGQAKNVFKLTANLPRGDVSQQYPGVGENHGYYGVLDIEGPEVLYVYFYNIGSGENTLIGTPTVQGKNHSPLGHIDGIESTYEGVKISGWAFDIDIPNDPIEVHIYVGGAADSGQAKNVFKLTADGSRADVPKKYPGVGENHGFEGLLDITGTETLYVYLYNVGLGENILIGTPTVTGKSHNPVGSIDNISSTCEGVKISGWAIDGDALTESVDIHIYVGGAADSGQAKNVYQIKADIFRQDLEDKFVIAGGKHGYSAILDIPGTEDIYIYLINKGSGANTLLGISTVSSKEHTLASIPINQKDATCIEEGYSGDKYCEVCKKIVEKGKTIPKMDHQWNSGEIIKTATCTEPGTKTYTCTNCNTTKTEEIPATGHQHTELRNASEATCAQEGYTGDTYCKDCGTKLSSGKIIAKTDHIWDAGKITKAATCKEPGTKTYTCTSCNTTKTEEIPATGNHQNTELRNVKAATCTEEGYTGDTYCKDCGTKLSSGKIIAKTDHIWDAGKITKVATCTESGTQTYTCTSCNTTRTEEIPATGNHQNTEVRNVKEATCLEEGYTGDTYCKDCGTKLSSGKTVSKKDHTWDSGKILKAATCKEAGIKTYTCTSCNTTRLEEIPATGNHQNTELRNVKEATCVQEGYTGDTYCKDCGEKLSSGKTIAKTDHIWDSGRITKPATDTESGIKTYTCINCNTTRTEEIPATGEHLNTELRGAKSATCLEEGYTGDTYCKDCGTKLSSGTVIPKTGHIWDEGVVTKATTCAEKGIRTYTCSICESTKIEEIPSTGHGTKITKFAKEATYTQEGYTGDIYCQDCGTLLEEGKVLAKLEQPKQTVTPGEMIGDKASNGVYKVLADGRSVEFVRQIVQSKAVKIPDTVSINGTIYAVTGISANAFKNNQLLRTTVIGRNVRRIGKQAFYNCKNLRTITIRTSMLTKKNVGAKAFKGTYKKVKVKVPAKQFKTYKKFLKSKGMGAKAIYKK